MLNAEYCIALLVHVTASQAWLPLTVYVKSNRALTISQSRLMLFATPSSVSGAEHTSSQLRRPNAVLTEDQLISGKSQDSIRH